jgi:hypothetical protein
MPGLGEKQRQKGNVLNIQHKLRVEIVVSRVPSVSGAGNIRNYPESCHLAQQLAKNRLRFLHF